MKRTIFFIFLIAIFFPGTVSAALYKYVDENGNVNYTDDFSQVPEDQREQYLQTEEAPDADNEAVRETGSEGELEPETSAADGDKEIAEDGQAETDNWPSTITEDEDPTETVDEMHTRLNSTREELKTEYSAIEKEKKELAATKKDAITPETISAYNKKAKSINERSKKFKEKNGAFQTDQKAYNKRVQELNAENEEKESAANEESQE